MTIYSYNWKTQWPLKCQSLQIKGTFFLLILTFSTEYVTLYRIFSCIYLSGSIEFLFKGEFEMFCSCKCMKLSQDYIYLLIWLWTQTSERLACWFSVRESQQLLCSEKGAFVDLLGIQNCPSRQEGMSPQLCIMLVGEFPKALEEWGSWSFNGFNIPFHFDSPSLNRCSC